MKYFSILFVLIGLFITTNVHAQLKLKKLDNVILSLGEGQSISDYNDYLSNYFSRISALESITEKSNFNLTTIGGKTYLQGNGKNETQQGVVFRVEVIVSEDGHNITKVNSNFEAQACVALSCTGCSFKDETSCACDGEGECKMLMGMAQ